jgi:hypothetical protein
MREIIVEVHDNEIDAVDSITEALDCFNINCYVYEKEEKEQTIKITVEGGVVVDVANLPPNFKYEIEDKDD